jgi:myo-inositol-1(or 4)-monophosphatase
VALSDAHLVDLLHEAAIAVRGALDRLDDWGLTGGVPGQHHSDLAADAAAIEVLAEAGVGVLSEESGLHPGDHDLTVVVDPVDGSTNAAHGIPWFATSLCAVDRDGPRAALVVDLAHGRTFTAVRGGGASVDGLALSPSGCTSAADAVVGISGMPPVPLGWRQFRALGAIALDLCAVAEGTLDGYVDALPSAHGPWDYLGGALVCAEAGAVVADAEGRELAVLDHAARRTPVAAGTPDLLADLLVARRRSMLPGGEGAAN